MPYPPPTDEQKRTWIEQAHWYARGTGPITFCVDETAQIPGEPVVGTHLHEMVERIVREGRKP
jgi:hypothetical protein